MEASPLRILFCIISVLILPFLFVLCRRVSKLGEESCFRGNQTENEKPFQQGPPFEVSFTSPVESCFLNFFLQYSIFKWCGETWDSTSSSVLSSQ